MAQAYQLIQAITVGAGGASSIDFTNIPQTYTDLVLVASTRTTNAVGASSTGLRFKFNNLTTNQSYRWLYGYDSGGTGSANGTVLNVGTIPGTSATTSTFASSQIYIPNYAGSNNKSASADSVSENNSTTSYELDLNANLWSSTAAINQVTLYLSSGNFAEFSTAYLYGIGGVRATGGTITADSKYTYHTFTSSGTFTALEKIKGAEVLVIAGGGGGGAGQGGGGGAGGVVYSLGSLINAGTSVSAVVGAGGAGGTRSTSTNGKRGTNGSDSQFGQVTLAVGGGGGGNYDDSGAGKSGGSGGGAGCTPSPSSGGTATSGQGNAGGSVSSYVSSYYGGGGGGAGAAGAAGGASGGTGGVGTSTYSAWGYATSTGQSSGGLYYYAGGGAGAGESATALGGLGGGASSASTASAGTANTGGGGGATVYNSSTVAAGAGGSGLVIVRYPN